MLRHARKLRLVTATSADATSADALIPPAVAVQATVSKAAPPLAATSGSSGGCGADILTKVDAQGLVVRELKGAKASKEEIKAAVVVLIALKKEYKDATGDDVPKK